MKPVQLTPIHLTGTRIELLPYEERHFQGLFNALQHPEIWDYMSYGKMPDEAEFREIVANSMANKEQGHELLFTIIERASGNICGSTRLFEYSYTHRRAEIGWTWLAPDYWHTGINPESKYLLLTHAFETLGLVRVQFKTDARNIRSQAAILNIGAVLEGTLRNHMTQVHTGYVRDSVIFSITNQDWPSVKARLITRLDAHLLHE